MKCINFDERFADFTAKWMKEHRGEYKTYDEMEDDLPRVYTEFLNMPAKWLDVNFNGAVRTAVRNCIVKQVCEGAFQQRLFGKHQGVAVNLQVVAMLFKNNVQKFCGFVDF